jgi:quinoprotein glucose dehydrogenase
MGRLTLVVFFICASAAAAIASDAGWSFYGGDEGGMRYSPAAQITPANVDNLVPVWSYSTGDIARRDAKTMRRTSLQDTPILVQDKLLICTSFNEVIALDPGTARELWRFDPKIPTDKIFPANKFNCRGVAAWHDTADHRRLCRDRVLAATNDARVNALDLATGKPCADFGTDGQVKVHPGMELKWPGEFQITSAPVVIGDVVVVGSSIGDNARVAAPHGTVRAFDVRTGAPKWSWDPVPRDPADPAAKTWGEGYKNVGHANVWAPMSADEKRGLIFLPTSSPSPDFFGGLRPGNNEHANSVVALNAETGTLVWAFQVVHHDVWDYDLPAQPTLAAIDLDGGKRDVVIQPTKQGFVFVLDRDTGNGVSGRRAARSARRRGRQCCRRRNHSTYSALVPQKISPDDAYGLTPGLSGMSRRICGGAQRGVYAAVRRHDPVSDDGRRINWAGLIRSGEADSLRQYDTRAASDHAVSRGEVRRTRRQVSREGSVGTGGGAVRDDPRDYVFAAGSAVQSAAVGRTCRRRHEEREGAVGGDAGHDGRARAARNSAWDRDADARWVADHGRRAGLYRRGDGQVFARVRREDRRGALAGKASGHWVRDTDVV